MPAAPITFTLKSYEVRDDSVLMMWQRSGLTPTTYPVVITDEELAATNNITQVLELCRRHLERKVRVVDAEAEIATIIGNNIVI